MSEDWYRNRDWNPKIEAEFFAKLGRARSQRDQYLVLQALSLVDTFPEITLRLVDQYFETRKDDFDDVRALLARTNALLKMDDIDAAIAAYRATIKREEEFPTLQTCAHLDYCYLVAIRKIESEYENALQVLSKRFESLRFPVDCFKWYAAKALIENDVESASMALEAATIEKSGLAHHQNVGLVGKEHAMTIQKLRQISP